MLAPYLGFGRKMAYRLMVIMGLMAIGVIAGIGIIIFFSIT